MSGLSSDASGGQEQLRQIRQINSVLGGVAAGGASAGSAGGGYSFEPDEMEAIIKDWRDLASGYDSDIANANMMIMSVRGPGKDGASEAQANATRESITSYMKSLYSEQKYCGRQADKFQAALNKYRGVEHAVAEEMNKRQEGLA